MTKEEWIEDLNYFVEKLETLHPNPYKNFNKEDFYKKIEELKNKSDNLNSDNMFRSISFLVALLKDAHTSLTLTTNYYEIPTKFKLIENKVYIVNTNELDKEALFKEVIFINNTPIDMFIKNLEQYISYETDAFKNNQLGKLLSNPSLLKRLGLIDIDTYNIIYNNDGKSNYIQYSYNELLDSGFNQEEKFYDFKYIEEQKALYIKYRSCKEDENYKIEDFIKDIDESMNLGVDKIIVDIRQNMGGDSKVIKPLIKKLEEYKEENREIFCLIDDGTFSSGRHALFDLKNIGAILIGSESGGSKGEVFGEVIPFTLPNSKVKVKCSTKIYKGLEDDTNKQFGSITPDYKAEATIEDLIEGRDVVLDTALEYHYVNEKKGKI